MWKSLQFLYKSLCFSLAPTCSAPPPPTPGGDCCATAGDITLFVDNLMEQRAGLGGYESASLRLVLS
jgi:hypothetical protein